MKQVSIGRGGFTIVELLIVVVVIAILAAITVVAFNGITAKANDSARQSDASMIKKAIQLRDVEYGASLQGVGEEEPSYIREDILALYGLQSVTERVIIINYDDISPPDFDRQKVYMNLYVACRGSQSGGHCSVPWTIGSVGYAYWSNTENVWLHMEVIYNMNGSSEINEYERSSAEGPFSMGNIAN